MNKQKGFVWLVVAIVVILVIIFFWNEKAVAPTSEGENASSTLQVTEAGTTTEAASVKPAIVSKPVAPVTPSPKMTSTGAYLVYFTAQGFSPANLSVPVRSTVRFYNSSNSSMSIMTLNDQLAPYSSLNQGKSVGRNGYFDFAFGVPGSYAYKNLNAAQYIGIVTVR